MKRAVQAVFFLFCALAFGIALYYLIKERSGAAAAAKPVTTRQVVVSNQGVAAEGRAVRSSGAGAVNHIAALPNEVILDVATFNLIQNEGGEGEEQILTVRKTDRPGGRLYVVVAAYLPARKAWARTWEGETLATKLTTFTIQAKDLVGDHSSTIVCMGMNESNEQTLTAFRRVQGAPSLVFSTICSFAADAVAVNETSRSEGYQLGQTNGDSWNILGFRRDKESQNLLDQVRTTYTWDAKKVSYVKASEDRIPGAQVEREMISKTLTGSEGDFENFLQGVWYENGKGQLDPGTRMIVFDRRGSGITFYSTEAQEVFRWIDSHPTRYGIYVGSQNESVTNLRRLMDIELTGSDAISVRIFEDLQMKVDAENRWDGIYRKVGAGQSEASARAAAAKPPALFKLEGRYRSSYGAELAFAEPRFDLKSGAKSERGTYSIYRLGKLTVFELNVERGEGHGSERRTYGATFTETKAGRETSRRLVLAPARVSIMGLELLEEPSLTFEQRSGG